MQSPSHDFCEHLLHGHYPSHYFWRTYDKNEVDLVELNEGEMNAFECKYKRDNTTTSLHKFNTTYKESKIYLVNKENFKEFL